MEIKGFFLVNIKKDNSYFYSFSIEHNNDYFILYKLYELYNIKVKIKNINNMSYILRTHKKDILNKVISYYTLYPLQGEKFILLNEFIKVFYK
jgi:LAGLIDADG endonuclease